MATTDGTGVDTPSVKEQRRRKRLEARQAARKSRRPKPDRLLVEFQPDAVELEHRPVPGGARFTLWTICLLIVGFVTWAWWAQVDRIVTAPGKLVTTQRPLVIAPLSTMEVDRIMVKFGDTVRAGDVLAKLDPTFSEADLLTLEQKRTGLLASIRRGTAEAEQTDFDITGHTTEQDWVIQYQFFRERRLEYESKLKEFDSEKEKLLIQQANTQNRIRAIQEKVRVFKELEATEKRLAERRSSSELDVLGRKLQRVEAETELVDLENTAREQLSDLEAVGKRRASFVASWRAQVATGLLEDHEKLFETEQELQKARRMRASVELKVPDDLEADEFIVLEVANVSSGSVVRSGEPMFRLMPVGAPLELEVEISGRDIAKVRAISDVPPDETWDEFEFPEGSTVSVKLNAFNYQRHGILEGVVRTISEGAFEKQEQGQVVAPNATYRARIRLRQPIRLENVPDDFRLMPGMTANAEIRVGKRRVLDYFLYPLLRYLDESIREP